MCKQFRFLLLMCSTVTLTHITNECKYANKQKVYVDACIKKINKTKGSIKRTERDEAQKRRAKLYSFVLHNNISYFSLDFFAFALWLFFYIFICICYEYKVLSSFACCLLAYDELFPARARDLLRNIIEPSNFCLSMNKHIFRNNIFIR